MCVNIQFCEDLQGGSDTWGFEQGRAQVLPSDIQPGAAFEATIPNPFDDSPRAVVAPMGTAGTISSPNPRVSLFVDNSQTRKAGGEDDVLKFGRDWDRLVWRLLPASIREPYDIAVHLTQGGTRGVGGVRSRRRALRMLVRTSS